MSHVASSGNLGHRRQGNRGDGHPKDTERQLHEAEGIAEPADRTIPEIRGKYTIDHDVDLYRAGRDNRRQHEPENPGHLRITPAKVKVEAKPHLAQAGKLHGHLQKSPYEGSDGHPDQGPRAKLGINQPRDSHPAKDGTEIIKAGG